MYTTLDLDRYSTWLEIKGNVALLRHRQAGLLRSKFDDDCIWMIRNAPYLSCPNWEDRRKSLTHIFTFVAYASPIQPNPKASALALLALLTVCLQTLVEGCALVAAQTAASWSQRHSLLLLVSEFFIDRFGFEFDKCQSVCIQTLAELRASGGPNHRFLMATSQSFTSCIWILHR